MHIHFLTVLIILLHLLLFNKLHGLQHSAMYPCKLVIEYPGKIFNKIRVMLVLQYIL